MRNLLRVDVAAGSGFTYRVNSGGAQRLAATCSGSASPRGASHHATTPKGRVIEPKITRSQSSRVVVAPPQRLSMSDEHRESAVCALAAVLVSSIRQHPEALERWDRANDE